MRCHAMRCSSSILQEDGKASCDTAEDDGKAEALSEVQHGRGSALAVAVSTLRFLFEGFGCISGLRVAEAVGVDAGGSSSLGGGRCRGLQGEDGRVRGVGVLGSAGVLLSAVGLAAVVAAVVGALDAPFGADVVGDGLGVLGDVLWQLDDAL